MKKILLVLAMIIALLVTGCSKNEDNIEENLNLTQESQNNTQEVQNNTQESQDNNNRESLIAKPDTTSPFVPILEDIYNKHVLPDGTELYNMENEEQMAENKFAVVDIDFDGKKELIFSYNSGAMADVADIIFDYDESQNKVIEQAVFSPSPLTKYYNSGIVYQEALHNQGLEDPWPYTLFKYNEATDKYEVTDEDIKEYGEEIVIPFRDLTLENIKLLQKEESFVNLSNSYYFDDYRELEMKEIVPSKAYLVDPKNTLHLDRYSEDVTISFPIEKCASADEERIVYSEYGIEKMLNSGKVLLGGSEIDTIHREGEADETFNYKDEVLYYYNLGLQKIYEVELDNDNATKELLIYSHFSYPWDSYEYPYLVKFENGVGTNMGVIESENIMQIGEYQNVLTDGWNSDIEGYFSNVLMGYYVYDKDSGLVHVEKMANGDDISTANVTMLDNCILKNDVEFGKLSEESLHADEVAYSTWAFDEEKEVKTLPKGTKIKIVEIVDTYGNFIGETEDGTMYGFFNYAGRT